MKYPSTAFGGSPPQLPLGRNFGQCAAVLSGLAARLLGWRPDEFWAATPAELAGALGADEARVEAVAGDELARLMARFPDRVE